MDIIFNIKMTYETMSTIGQALQELPAKTALPIMRNLEDQAQQQMKQAKDDEVAAKQTAIDEAVEKALEEKKASRKKKGKK